MREKILNLGLEKKKDKIDGSISNSVHRVSRTWTPHNQREISFGDLTDKSCQVNHNILTLSWLEFLDGINSRLIPTSEWFVTSLFFFYMCDLQTARTSRCTNNLEMKVLNILLIDTMPHYCCAGECINSCDWVTKAIRDDPWWQVYWWRIFLVARWP